MQKPGRNLPGSMLFGKSGSLTQSNVLTSSPERSFGSNQVLLGGISIPASATEKS